MTAQNVTSTARVAKKRGQPRKAKTSKIPAKRGRPAKTSGKCLVLVESPTKAKTIEKYLGNGYIVKASMGHLRDLPKSQFGIDVENNFEPKYINIRGKGDLIKDLKREAKMATHVYLASDPDREGEAIAWHLAHILDLDETSACRIEFNEITKSAIKEAIKHPRPIDIDRVDAQQARRMLDRIVGYRLSPLLWQKIRKGLSAGRVQSVTCRLICDREKEIKDFVSEEYWTMSMNLRKNKSPMFVAEVLKSGGKKLNITNKSQANQLAFAMEQGKWQVVSVKASTRSRKPYAPFTTSSMQQDASRKLGFISRKTMQVAQQLYEGIDIGRKGPTGLITYMRTDSTRISEMAQAEAKEFIVGRYGADYAPEKPNIYAVEKKAQDAHEAIRPTSVGLTPEFMAKYLNRDQLKLYTLIWQRFVASQMVPVVYDTVNAVISLPASEAHLVCDEQADNEFCHQSIEAKSIGSKLKFDGYTVVYSGGDDKSKDVLLPELVEGDLLTMVKSLPQQHFTEPLPRYNEASLVKTLEEKGIGRPSTYAPIIETIIARGYVIRSQKQFQPTELGCIVIDMLKEYFKDIVDEKFTADMENRLDSIAVGDIDKTDVLKSFYGPFDKTLAEAQEAIGEVEVPVEVTDIPCDQCGSMMVVKLGRYGKFLACPNFPECRCAKPILKEIGVACPVCGGNIVERRTRHSRMFYGCANYPECSFVTWDMPQKTVCEKCGSMEMRHFFKNGSSLKYCYNDACETRIDHPINKELARQKKKAEEKRLKAEAAAEDKKSAEDG